MSNVLKDNDIKNVLKSIQVASEKNFVDVLKSGGFRPVQLSNGYKATLTMDVMSENKRLLHLSVYKNRGDTDTVIAQKIADEIIGDGNIMIGPMYDKNNIHFMKLEEADTMVELMKKLREEK